ncbi:dihydroneopterin aldolase [Pullulanibacillus pueri]|uniref:7,8-dihydroneopterin aldolase n=1 Tax=Pullulanibacillus pueri TaxID=1437324 RepID=A0A8J3ENH1_9BACL|nr:dihydroneopterin aldolase [Pullulanibacillus pueri]MBM7683960.1 dihydroneopterin aldolase [Pullulanibacillus pueri]GGH87963.1 dihydroneopterin aldolase [Pullulanibacillus pueri]
MDKIYLNGMSFYGYHGVFPEENTLGQRFIVDVVLYVDLKTAGMADNLEETINYAEVYQLTRDIVEGPEKQLVEAVAEDIAKALLNQFAKVKECVVKVIKPDPPIPGHYDSVAVEIVRTR